MVTLVTNTASASTFYVGGGGPGNYTTIQSAVDASSPGDTIYVFKGIYEERITISKSLTLIGEDMDNTVVDGGRVADVVVITADWVNVNGFTVRNSSWNAGDAGIELSGVQHCHLFGNNVSHNNGNGIYLTTSSYNNISDNFLFENWDPDGAGILLASSDSNIITGNYVFGNAKGIYLSWSNDNIIAGNNLSTNWDYGAYLWMADGNTIDSNSFFDNWARGVRVTQSSTDNIVSNNTFIQNYQGIYFESSADSVIVNNTLLNNWDDGIGISSTSGIRVANNSLHGNWGDGIEAVAGSYNLIENNSIDGSYRADIALVSAQHETILNNTMAGGGVFIDGSAYTGKSLAFWNTHTIPTSNTVNGKPVYYWKDVVGGSIPLDAGQAILANCQNVVVEDMNVSSVAAGVEAGFSSGITISNITSWDAYYSILLMKSQYIDVHDAVLSEISQMGVNMVFTHDSMITNVTVLSGDYAGAYLRNSYRNDITTFNVSGVDSTGIFLDYSGDNSIARSNFLYIQGSGAYLSASKNNTFSNASFIGNRDGVVLRNADNNTFDNNTIASNDRAGITTFNSNMELFFHNDFIDNGEQADDNGLNSWDDGYPSGGNFWSDYTGTDIFSGPSQDIPGSDGIGDTPYAIPPGTNEDRYPLMNSSLVRPWRPFAPLNLQASAGIGNVTLIWDAPASDGGSEITNYSVYRGFTPTSKTLLEQIGNVTSYFDSGLEGGRAYYYQVSAKNVVGEGRKSNTVNATPIDLPGTPWDFIATPGDAMVTLFWSEPSNDGGSPITNYTIYRGDFSGGETALVKLGNQESYVDLNVTNRQTYFYQVSAWNIVGEGQRSAEKNATPASVPSPPVNLTAVPEAGHILLNWSLPADDGGSPITTYMLYRGTTTGGESPMWTVGNTLSHADTNVTGGVTYFYQMAAINAIGEGALSIEANATAMGVPSEPLNLTAVGGNGFVSLSWVQPLSDGGSPITGYTIFRGLTSGSEIFHATTGVAPVFDDTGLTNGITYYYKVSASNAVGDGLLSIEAYATPMTVPGPPTGVFAVSTYAAVTVEWQAPLDTGGSPVTNYSIYRGTSPGGESFLATIGNLLQYTDANVTNGQTYYYMVTAINAAGEGPFSLEVRILVPDHPSAPLNLLAASGNQQVTLSWDPPSSDGGCLITNYSIYRGFWSGGETLLTTVGVVTSFLDAGLTNGVEYYYRVSAINPVGEGPKSNEAVAKPSSLPSPPTIASAIGINREVVLTIVPPSDTGGLPIITYKMYRGTSPGGEIYLVDIGTPSKHFDAGLTNGVTYCYKLTAMNANGESAQSGEACATPLAVPSQPLGLGAVSGNGQVQLSWQSPDDDGGAQITTYKIYRGLVSGGETLLVTLGDVRNYVDSSVTNGITYFYTVSASNSAGEGPRSSEVSATPHPPPTVPGAPENLQATAGFGIVTLSWQPPPDYGGEMITSYTIYRGTTPSALTQIGAVGGLVTDFLDAAVTGGATYYYEVTATNSIGEGPRSNTATVMLPGPPGQPNGLTVVAGTLQATLAWNAPASDGGSPITDYRIYRGKSPGASSPIAIVGNVFTFTDTGLAGGQTYYYSVSAVNAIGEGLKSAEQSVAIAQIPNELPSCSISAPAQGSTISGTFTVWGTASDSDGEVILVEVRIDGGEWKGVYGIGPWSYSLNTKLLSNGEHVIEARAYDGADLSQPVSVTVSVDNPAKPGLGGNVESNAAGIAVVIALLTLAVLLGFFVFKEKPWRKKGKGGVDESPAEEDEGSVEAAKTEERAVSPEENSSEADQIDDGLLDDDDDLT